MLVFWGVCGFALYQSLLIRLLISCPLQQWKPGEKPHDPWQMWWRICTVRQVARGSALINSHHVCNSVWLNKGPQLPHLIFWDILGGLYDYILNTLNCALP